MTGYTSEFYDWFLTPTALKIPIIEAEVVHNFFLQIKILPTFITPCKNGGQKKISKFD